MPQKCRCLTVPPSTARKLSAYREELQAHGFTAEQAWLLVVRAASNAETLAIGSEFLVGTEPVFPPPLPPGDAK